MGSKLVQINTVCNTSTGQIMHDIQTAAEKKGYETVSFVGRRKVYTDVKCERFGNPFSFWIHVALNTVFDCQGHGSYFVTRRLIKRLREEKPDIIHLHNLHGYYLNLPLLFQYINQEYRGKVFWTFHDCWPFTGHCAYFTMAGCSRWETGCEGCPQKKSYPVSLVMDRAKKNYAEKREMFSQIKNLTIITPSGWLRGLVAHSFLKDKKTVVVNNGIDTEIFRPCNDPKEIERVLRRHAVPSGKKILLGVAGIWEKRKGLKTFEELAACLPEDYVIVLVGLTKWQIVKPVPGIIGIGRTENKRELAALYTAADIFINPSQEESFSLVTAEAMACGTPVIVLGTSAVRELVGEGCGVVLEENRIEGYTKAIEKIEAAEPDRQKIAEHGSRYGRQNMTGQILKLYEGLQ